MRTLILAAAAPAALLALAAAAAPGPASAGPLRLDEGRLAGVAAGQEVVVTPVAPATPSFSASTSQVTSNSSNATSSFRTAVDQAIVGRSASQNTAVSLSATDVTATGGAMTAVVGAITP